MGHESKFDVQVFVNELQNVAVLDADLNRASKPAIEKLKMLPAVWSKLYNGKYSRQLRSIRCGVLVALRNWLEPLPDGSLPSKEVRNTVLELLTVLPIDVKENEFKTSGIGKAVMYLFHLPEETPANTKLAKELIEKWSREIFKISDNFQDVQVPYGELTVAPGEAEVSQAVTSVQETEKQVKQSGRVFVEVPLPSALDFPHKPKPKPPMKRKKEKKPIYRRLNSKMFHLKDKNKMESNQARQAQNEERKILMGLSDVTKSNQARQAQNEEQRILMGLSDIVG